MQLSLVSTALASFVFLPTSAPPPPAKIQSAHAGRGAGPGDEEAKIVDQPLAAHRRELLEVAYSIASRLPLHPHVKNRARLQGQVVAACFELDQPQLALECLALIPNWRQGAAHADYALYCAERGAEELAREHLERALEVARGGEEELGQAWRRDRILTKVAKVRYLLGEGDSVAEIEAGVEPVELGQLEVWKAQHLDAEAVAAQIEAFERSLSAASFDEVKNAHLVLAEIYDRFYEDEARRESIETSLREARSKVPLQLFLEQWMRLAGYALDHADQAGANELIAEAQGLLDSEEWLPQHRIPLDARLAALRHRAGDSEEARAQADRALGLFQRERDKIVDVFRTEALVPLAEGYQALEVPAAALMVYGKAVDEALQNPNSRPRAEDLVAICRSMALADIEPDKNLLTRIRTLQAELGDPW